MGGSMIDDDWELDVPSKRVSTLVLVGKTGNGKSATGNSILGWKAFKSQFKTSGVTATCELQETVLPDGRKVNVIDTPGLFDCSPESKYMGKEIAKCMEMAKDGIHAVLLVLSIRNRFSREEEASIHSLRAIFGEKMVKHMIIIFTNGDALEDQDGTFDDYLDSECPESLQQIRRLCEDRIVLFDNKTKDKRKHEAQVNELFSVVDLIITSNGGRPYSDDLLVEIKKKAVRMQDQRQEIDQLTGCSKQEILLLKDQIQKSYEEQLLLISEMVENKLKAYVEQLQKQLAEEKAARLKAEKIAQELLAAEQESRKYAEQRAEEAQRKSQQEIHELRKKLERAQKESEEIRKQVEEQRSSKCSIL